MNHPDPEDAALIAEAFTALGRSFRGEIWEDDPDVPMGKGYANDNQPFDITTAHYLKPVFRAIRNPAKRKIVNRKAVQTLGTYACEKSASYFIKHFPDEMVLYDCDIEAAKDHAKSRLGPLLRSAPGIGAMMADLDRHDITNTIFNLPGMTLRIWPLNESSTQRFTARYVFIHDAFLAKRNGMIEQAIARTTQHPKDKKIIIESQGGEEGDDFDRQWLDTDQCELWVKCIHCGTGQPFEWQRLRPDDFVPVTQPIENCQLQIENCKFPWEPPKAGTYSGFQRGDEKTVRGDGDYDEEEIIRQTHYECFHCGGKWHDDPATRRALDESSYYVPTNPNALPEHSGFCWPGWINQRLGWGKDFMLPYLKAKRAAEEQGNREPLKQWWQKKAARAWRPDLGQKLRAIAHEKYDINAEWPKFWRRVLIVDVQKEMQTFWASAFDVSKDAESRQIWRGPLAGIQAVRAKQQELNIKDQYVFLDAKYFTTQVLDACAQHGHWGVVNTPQGKFRQYFCWNGLQGSPNLNFGHREEQDADKRFAVSDPREEFRRIGKYNVPVLVWQFSALQCGDMAAIHRDGKGPETLFLAETESTDNQLSWTRQLYSHTRHEIIDKRTGLKTARWLPWDPKESKENQNIPDHYWHILRMLMAVFCIWGIAGDLTRVEEKLIEVKAE